MSKKILSVLLALVMVLAMGTVALVSVSADLADLPEQPADTYRYYFYMPPQWLNESTETTGNTAGIYWWEGTDAHGGWPGIAANKADVEGVYYYDVPTDVTTIVWNNFFDGGADATAPYYADAVQTRNIPTEYYDPGESDLYPDGTPNFDGMIFVTDFTIYDYNDYSKKLQFGGEWFYYYGNGEYGTSVEKGGSEVYTAYATNNDKPFPKDGPQTTEPATTAAPTTAAPTTAAPTTAAPTTAAPTTAAPTTAAPTTSAPVVTPDNTGVKVGDTIYDVAVGDTITYTTYVTAAELFEDFQAVLSYDSAKLELVRKTDDEELGEDEIACPELDGLIFNADIDGVVKFNATKYKGINFKTEKVLITLDFVVLDNTMSSIDLLIEEMTIKGGEESYFTAGQPSKTEGITVRETLEGGTPTTKPVTTAPTTAAPTTAAPTTAAPTTAAPTTAAPTTAAPTTAAPTTAAPTTAAPTTAAPTTAAPTTAAPTTAAPTTAAPTTAAPVVTAAPTTAAPTTAAPATTAGAVETIPTADVDPTSVVGTTGTQSGGTSNTGAATYIYVVLAIMAMAACAVVVLRKKAND